MDEIVWRLVRRLRPRVGWLQFGLALAAALCPAYAASVSRLGLPAGSFVWAGLLGLAIGLRLGRPSPRRRRLPLRTIGFAAAAALLLGCGALLVAAAANTLPPIGLAAQDARAWLGWLRLVLRRDAGWAEAPEAHSLAFLAATLPRLWADLLAAPAAGEPGARLIVLAAGVAGTWLAVLVLGWALARGRNLFGWALPMLVAICFTTLAGGGSGAELVFGLALLLVLTLIAGMRRRERAWERGGADFSDELGADALVWGGLSVVMILILALVVPTPVSNPLADLFWRDVELPSGIAVLERNIPRPPSQPRVNIGISQLPALPLGQSLEGVPPEQVILRVHTGAPLPPAPWPRYWRARVFNFYTGRDWTTNARVGAFPASQLNPDALPGGVVQEIEDLRDERAILVALPDVLGLDMAAQSERLPDGSLAALTSASDAPRYRVLSRPQELAAPPRVDGPPIDMSSYLALPKSYPQRVIDLARATVGARTAPYQQALALEAFLRGLPYAYQVRPIPAGGDAVEQFLFEMRQGYCTYYASAMAVMARGLGIPARLAIGYATGEYDEASGAYLVRQADAHAWPELYIDGRWLPFEPTPVRALPARDSTSSAPPTPAPAPAAAPADRARFSGPLIWALVLVAVAGLSALGWWRRARRVRALVPEVQRSLERAGARAGIAWPRGATLHEYGSLLAPHSGTDDTGAVVELVGEARYSGRALGADEERRLRAAADRVLARLRAARRQK